MQSVCSNQIAKLKKPKGKAMSETETNPDEVNNLSDTVKPSNTKGGSSHISGEKLKILENIEVTLSIEVGRTEMTIRDLLRLNEGSVIELDRLAGEPLDLFVNGAIIAKGEVVMVGERYGIRLTDIVDPEERAESV